MTLTKKLKPSQQQLDAQAFQKAQQDNRIKEWHISARVELLMKFPEPKARAIYEMYLHVGFPEISFYHQAALCNITKGIEDFTFEDLEDSVKFLKGV